MAELLAPLAQATLIGGMSVVLEAIDPTSGTAVTGVKVSKFTLYGDTLSGTDDSGGSAPLDTSSPVWVPTSLDDLNPEDAAIEAAAAAVAPTVTGGTAAGTP